MLPTEPLVYITLVALIPICNPLSTVPLFLSLTRKHTNAERNRQAFLASVYMFAILSAFAVGGSYIIAFFSISVPAIRIAGGAIVGYIGFRMLFPVESEQSGDKNTPPPKKDVAFSPLAMPSLAGPGSISVVLAIAGDTTDPLSYLFICIGILIMAAIAFAVLRLAAWLQTKFGLAGINIMTSIMGFLLICVAVQFIHKGVSTWAQEILQPLAK